MNKVAITGMGVVTALGEDVPTVWRRLLAGENGISRITFFDPTNYGCKVAAEVKALQGAGLRERDNYRLDSGLGAVPGDSCRRSVQIFLKAARDAFADSGLGSGRESSKVNGAEIGVAAGASVAYIDHEMVTEQYYPMRRGDGKEIDLGRFAASGREPESSFPRRLGDLMAAVPAKALGLSGPMTVIDTACAASGHAIGEAFRMIRRGRAKAMLAGGVSALVGPISILYFAILGALSRCEDPDQASRPFDSQRDGFVMGEGGGAVMLEDMEHAKARGARIYAELAGYASSLNAHNLTDPSPDGECEASTMRMALRDAQLAPEEIDYVAAHGTSTPKNDATEALAIKKTFGAHARLLLVSSNKGQIGHTIAGAGVCNLITVVKAMEEGCVPPTVHHRNPDPDCDLDIVPNVSRPAKIRAALANAFAFGGQNAVLAVRAMPS